jgi:hypothetical protein
MNDDNRETGVPSNEHIWEDLHTLAQQLHVFKQRISQRQTAFMRGADELRQAEQRCQRLISELAEIHPE